jgi:hypothetical protein
MKKNIRLLGGTSGPETAGAADLFLPGKEVTVSEIIAGKSEFFLKLFGKTEIIRQICKHLPR